MCSVFASCAQKNQLSGVERSAAFSFAGQQSTGMGNSNALARPRGRPAPEKRCEHCRNTPQHRDARNARALRAKTQMKHHATSTRFNVDIMIAWCNNCVDVYAGRQKNLVITRPRGTCAPAARHFWSDLHSVAPRCMQRTWPGRGDANDAPREAPAWPCGNQMM